MPRALTGGSAAGAKTAAAEASASTGGCATGARSAAANQGERIDTAYTSRRPTDPPRSAAKKRVLTPKEIGECLPEKNGVRALPTNRDPARRDFLGSESPSDRPRPGTQSVLSTSYHQSTIMATLWQFGPLCCTCKKTTTTSRCWTGVVLVVEPSVPLNVDCPLRAPPLRPHPPPAPATRPGRVY